MQKILALCDDENQGKTETLNVLVELLSSVADFVEIYRDNGIDSYAWFKINEKYVFVGTSGDEAKTVKANINYTKKYACMVGITASRNDGDTKEVVNKQLTDDGNHITPISKKELENKISKKISLTANNRLIAARLFQEIVKETCPKLFKEDL